ncbi:hypothetical protein Nepgr_012160 [Nepenthes gracilis]|uniref:Uncharacterized protein n=1 Tax=Nepenthes gracilis TaxID=150966 RepID=A0AAD3XMW9_NEPGR|nr:hypothetical protein Nepgr_012160 [Nepenthes gracilis]
MNTSASTGDSSGINEKDKGQKRIKRIDGGGETTVRGVASSAVLDSGNGDVCCVFAAVLLTAVSPLIPANRDLQKASPPPVPLEFLWLFFI